MQFIIQKAKSITNDKNLQDIKESGLQEWAEKELNFSKMSKDDSLENSRARIA